MRHSPLAAFRLAAGASLRTGLTHLFSRRTGVDRKASARLREQCRAGAFDGHTHGAVPGFVQASLIALPEADAFGFLRFCLANAHACPVLDVCDTPTPHLLAPGADLRTDLPKYRVWRGGEAAEEASDARHVWDEGMVGFLLGGSPTWEHLLHEAGLTPRHVSEGKPAPTYRTSVPNAPMGRFGGQLVVSARPYAHEHVEAVAALTARYPCAHGAPVHWGDPAEIGVRLDAPESGEPIELRAGETPVRPCALSACLPTCLAAPRLRL